MNPKEIIDLSEWNEYISDDSPTGKIPLGIELEFLMISTSLGVKENDEMVPRGISCDSATFKNRIFWRYKR